MEIWYYFKIVTVCIVIVWSTIAQISPLCPYVYLRHGGSVLVAVSVYVSLCIYVQNISKNFIKIRS